MENKKCSKQPTNQICGMIWNWLLKLFHDQTLSINQTKVCAIYQVVPWLDDV
jgi:hypothetical protein